MTLDEYKELATFVMDGAQWRIAILLFIVAVFRSLSKARE